MGKQSPIHHKVSNKTDGSNFQTPPKVCRYMAKLILPGTITICEPTPGRGNLVKAVREKSESYIITAPDDFFLMPSQRFDCVIMNPPFSSRYANMENAPAEFQKAGMRLGYQMLSSCLQMADQVIALMPWFTISDSDVRLRNLKRFGMKSVTALPRGTFRYARIQTVVLDLQKGFKGKTEFKVMDTFNDHRQSKLIYGNSNQ